MASIDLSLFREREAQGLITCRAHPTGKLLIWNYTAKCSYERAWDDITIQARGLITTPDGEIVARPFEKFFNLEEHQGDLPLEPFTVTTKMDGSLGILYFLDGMPQIATRGSFSSEQAVKATAMLHEKYGGILGLLKPHYTYLFEIIYPDNRIVVDYGGMEDLVLLAVIHTESGLEVNLHWPTVSRVFRDLFPLVKHYDGINDMAELRAIEEKNAEGFVVRFASGLRLKLKFAEYVRLHRLMTSTSNRTIWEYLKENRPLAEILDHVPPEFEAWVRKTSKELGKQYLDIHNQVEAVYKDILATTTINLPFAVERILSAPQFRNIDALMKKRIQERFAEYPAITPFLLMKWDGCKYYYPDGRRVTDKKAALRLHIWDSLYPDYSRPFITEGEEA